MLWSLAPGLASEQALFPHEGLNPQSDLGACSDRHSLYRKYATPCVAVQHIVLELDAVGSMMLCRMSDGLKSR